ncbi:MAG: ubiquinol-cytochrome c reductase cytochrome b subunit [Actinomycetota bacterium]|nr:ubiquinol-cytochrome c reductase cytochrome b subunit [Actinomycetota bacterium]
MTLTGKAVGGTGRFIDDRLGSASFFRRSLNKVFPDHWSFMLGEIALYSFVILLLTGTYLTLFFDASVSEVAYNGSYVPLKGVTMSQAYNSTLHINFDVRGGLVIRQIHHWAALLFLASIVVHLMRVFFTGAFRKPRELNWLVGVTLLVLGILEGFAGYSLPDDLLSGTGLRIGYSIAQSIPVVGSWAAFLVFGGEYPGEAIIGRLYVIHILLIPGIILALITAHMMILWHQKHTDFPGPGRTENNVVGSRMFPTYAAKGGGFFFIVFGVLTALGGLAQINPIWLYGPYNPSQVSAGSQPDWYVGWMDGALRLMPSWEFRGFGHTIPFQLLVPGVVIPGILFTVLALYPFIEAFLTKDKGYHNLLDRPRDRPVRTSLGTMSLAFYLVLLLSGGNDVIAAALHMDLQGLTWAGRIMLFVVPPIVYWITYRICVGLQEHDSDEEHHGVETGRIVRTSSGEFIEVHEPKPERQQIVLSPVPPEHVPAGALSNGGNGSKGSHSTNGAHAPAGKRGVVSAAGRAVGGFFVAKKPPQPTPAEQQLTKR